MARRLLLDFDGTLVDSRRRQYHLFVELATGAVISFDEYWRCKRAGTTQGEMLRRYCQASDDEVARFKASWMDAIEELDRLDHDVLIGGVPDFLAKAGRDFELYLVTGRQYFDRLMVQLKKLGIDGQFSGVLNTSQRQSKIELVRSRLSCAAMDVFVGDTGEDILTGRNLGIYTVGVTSGASSSERLQWYGPDLIVESVADLDPVHLGWR